jgi:hypothetical protein
MAGALDINGRAAGNAASLSSKDGNGRAPELSGIVGTAGALDINGRATGNAAGLSSRNRNVHSLSPMGQLARLVHLTSMAERLATLPAYRAGTRTAVCVSSLGRWTHLTSMA